MTTTVTFTVGDRVYRGKNKNRIGTITKMNAGSRHRRNRWICTVSITTGTGTVTEKWNMKDCVLAD